VPPPPGGGALPVAPSSFGAEKPDGQITAAVAQYNPRTGEYVGSDGKLYKVTNLAKGTPMNKTWKDLLLSG
jgi:hypothetical protein